MTDILLSIIGPLITAMGGLSESLSKDNKKLVAIASSVFALTKCDDILLDSAEKVIKISFEALDDSSKRVFILDNNVLILVLKIVLIAISTIPVYTIASIRRKISQLRGYNKDKIEITDLPEECIGEMQALEKRWQKQNLSDEEIQANIEFFKRDMQIGQRNMKRDEIKHKIWSLIMRMMSQLGQLLSI